MSLFESLVKAGSGAVELLRTRDSSPSGILAVVQGLAQDHGGLSGLLAKFDQAGLGEQVKSWIGTGSNLPISAQHVLEVLASFAERAVARQRPDRRDAALTARPRRRMRPALAIDAADKPA